MDVMDVMGGVDVWLFLFFVVDDVCLRDDMESSGERHLQLCVVDGWMV